MWKNPLSLLPFGLDSLKILSQKRKKGGGGGAGKRTTEEEDHHQKAEGQDQEDQEDQEDHHADRRGAEKPGRLADVRDMSGDLQSAGDGDVRAHVLPRLRRGILRDVLGTAFEDDDEEKEDERREKGGRGRRRERGGGG